MPRTLFPGLMVLLLDTHAPAHDCAVVGVVTHVPAAGAKRAVNYEAQVTLFRPDHFNPRGEDVYVGKGTRYQFATPAAIGRAIATARTTIALPASGTMPEVAAA